MYNKLSMCCVLSIGHITYFKDVFICPTRTRYCLPLTNLCPARLTGDQLSLLACLKGHLPLKIIFYHWFVAVVWIESDQLKIIISKDGFVINYWRFLAFCAARFASWVRFSCRVLSAQSERAHFPSSQSDSLALLMVARIVTLFIRRSSNCYW